MMVGGYLIDRRREQGRKLASQIARSRPRPGGARGPSRTEKVRRARRAGIGEVPAVATGVEPAVRLDPLLWTRRPEHLELPRAAAGRGSCRPKHRQTPTSAASSSRTPGETGRGPLAARSHWSTTCRSWRNWAQLGRDRRRRCTGYCRRRARGLVRAALRAALAGRAGTAAALDPARAEELEWLKWLPQPRHRRTPVAGTPLAASGARGPCCCDALEALVERRSGTRRSRRGPLRGVLTVDRAGTGRRERGDDRRRGPGVRLTPPARGVYHRRTTLDAAIVRGMVEVDRARRRRRCIFPVWVSADGAVAAGGCRTFVDATEGPIARTVGYVRAGEHVNASLHQGVTRTPRVTRASRPVVDSSSVTVDYESDPPEELSRSCVCWSDRLDATRSGRRTLAANDSILDRGRAPSRCRRPARCAYDRPGRPGRQ